MTSKGLATSATSASAAVTSEVRLAMLFLSAAESAGCIAAKSWRMQRITDTPSGWDNACLNVLTPILLEDDPLLAAAPAFSRVR